MDFGPQCFRNSGRMLSGPCTLTVLICLMAEDSSLIEKRAEREPPTLGAFQSLVHSLFASLNFPLSSNRKQSRFKSNRKLVNLMKNKVSEKHPSSLDAL